MTRHPSVAARNAESSGIVKRLGTAVVVVAAVIGVALGVGAYTFVYARGASYLTNDPNACANCHIMREQLDGWIASSHLNGRSRNVSGDIKRASRPATSGSSNAATSPKS